eukprot:1894228-Amphidinium_carterae.3
MSRLKNRHGHADTVDFKNGLVQGLGPPNTFQSRYRQNWPKVMRPKWVPRNVYEVARFAAQGQLARNEEAMVKQDANVSSLRQRAEKTQSRFEKVVGPLDGIDVPVREAVSQIYAEKERIDDIIARLTQLEDNRTVASDTDMCVSHGCAHYQCCSGNMERQRP